MFDHVGFGVSDLAASKAFFLKALAPPTVALVMEGPYGVGIGRDGKPSLWLHETQERPAPLQYRVQCGHARRRRRLPPGGAGRRGPDNSAPGLRPHHPNYYGAFVIGPTDTTSRRSV